MKALGVSMGPVCADAPVAATASAAAMTNRRMEDKGVFLRRQWLKDRPDTIRQGLATKARPAGVAILATLSTSKGDPRRAVYSNRRLKVAVLLLTLMSLPLVALFGVFLWIFVRSSGLVDARLEEARNRVPSRVYSRPVSIRTSDHMAPDGFV